jgi:hypothetical protein
VLNPATVGQFSQLLGIHLEVSRPIRSLYGPRNFGGDLSGFAPGIIVAPCDDFAGNKNGLRELAIRPKVSISENWQFLYY